MTALRESILVRLAHGDTAAGRACIDRFGPLVWSLARRHTQARADAEDAVQEIFVQLIESAGRYDPSLCSEAGFVAMIARRRLIGLARRRAVRSVESTTEGKRGSDPGATPLEVGAIARGMRADENLDAKVVARAIAELPEEEREVLVLATLGGRSYAEIATERGLPLGTVKTYARRGLLRVRTALAPAADPPVPVPRNIASTRVGARDQVKP